MSTSTRVLKNTGYLYMKMAITLFVSLYTTRLILNALGASDFGIFNVVGGAIAMLGFLNQAMASATQRFMSFAEGEGKYEKKKIIFNISMILHIMIAFVVLIVLLIAAFFFFNGILNIELNRVFAAQVVYGSLIISTVLTILNVPYDAVMNAHENMLYFSVVGIIEAVLKLLVAFACVYTSFDKLIVYGVLMACIPAVTLLIMVIYCKRHYDECVLAPRKYFDKIILKDMTKFAGWNFFSSFAGLVSGHGTNIVLNHFFGTKLNAASGISWQLNGQLQVFGNTLLKALNPVLVKSEGENNRQKMFKFAFTGAKLTVCMFAFFAIPVVVDRDYILSLWLKNVPSYTSEFIKYLLLWTFFSQIAGTLATSVGAIGNIKRMSLWVSVILLSNIAILYIAFLSGADPEFFMILSCLTSLIQASIYVFYSWKLGNMNVSKYMSDVVARVAAGIIVTYGIVYILWAIMPIGFIRLMVLATLSILIYSVVFYRVTLNKDERHMIAELVCNLKLKLFDDKR